VITRGGVRWLDGTVGSGVAKGHGASFGRGRPTH
jgi:hypothetical protein